MQTTDPMEEPSCGSSESGNDIGCQHSGAVTLFENPAAVESYLDCEYSIFGKFFFLTPLIKIFLLELIPSLAECSFYFVIHLYYIL